MKLASVVPRALYPWSERVPSEVDIGVPFKMLVEGVKYRPFGNVGLGSMETFVPMLVLILTLIGTPCCAGISSGVINTGVKTAPSTEPVRV